MNKNSIIFSITLTFVITFIVIIFSFLTLYISNDKREEELIKKSNHEMSKIFLREHRFNGYSKELEEILGFMNFSLITDKELQNSILNNKNTKLFESKYKQRHGLYIKNLKLDNINYVYIKTPRNSFMLVNENNFNGNKNIIIFIFILVFALFIFLYTSTVKKLKPLSDLKDDVHKLADENFEISCATDKKDEISQLANEFDRSAKKLKKLKESRNIFIRNIMHELKTPITKGRFLTELENNEENSLKMKKVFYRLEALINEFASIEELISTKKELNIKEYYLDDLVDDAIDLLMCSEQSVIRDFENVKVNVDFKLFSIAIKNMIDNGIKYSPNNKVTIKIEDKNIVFENEGNDLKYDLEKYFEPFFKGDDVKSNQSFGLGLYIIKHILDAHKFDFKHRFKENKNFFYIKC